MHDGVSNIITGECLGYLERVWKRTAGASTRDALAKLGENRREIRVPFLASL